ncbi:low-affinity inorganic phosphate transporter [Cutibacterium acnes JCM 18916]|nr:low-affinity inorganic phosphate transporter [Cutibacterium acnes JCM 18916]
MSSTLLIVVIVVVTALAFDFTNGFHDSANAMATSVATGALKPKVAVIIAAVLNVIGACLSTEVAKTISGGIVNDHLVTAPMVFAGLIGAIIWNLATWLFGLPSSSSHALFGGLIGAVLVEAGMSGIDAGKIMSKIVLPALVAPFVAGIAALVATWLAYRITNTLPTTLRGCSLTASESQLPWSLSRMAPLMVKRRWASLPWSSFPLDTSLRHWPRVVGHPGCGVRHRSRYLLGWLAHHADHGQRSM